MNVHWHKLGSSVLAATLAIGFCATVLQAQSSSSSVSGWHDGSMSDDDADASPVHPSSDRPARPSAAPRAGSAGYTPAYQEPDADQYRPSARRPKADSNDRPLNNDSTNSMRRSQSAPPYTQYGDQRRPMRPMNQSQQYGNPTQQYGNPQANSTSGPYYGYPQARVRAAAYSRQDVEYAEDQPHMPPGSVMSSSPGEAVGMPSQYGPPMMEGPPGDVGGPDGGCANGNCADGGCCNGSCEDCWTDGPRKACRSFNDWCRCGAFRDFSVYGGVEGFKGPIDLGENANFGLHEGFNWGFPIWGCGGVGAQMGAEFDQSDFAPNATVFGDHRQQYFLTAGVFYRPTRECGWQGGLVWDYLDDQFYDVVTVDQLRGNLSYVVDWSEFGFEFAAGVHSELHTPPMNIIRALPSILFEPVDTYTLYYGRRLKNGGQVKGFAGVANGLGAIFGASLDMAITDSFSLEGEFAYVIPDEVPAGSIPGETANIAFSVVWHPGCHARDTFDSAYRPLFNVADNSSFIVNERRQ